MLYTDIDTIWLQDPLPYFTNTTIDLFVQSDPENEHDPIDKMTCTGFLLFKASSLTVLMAKWWIDMLMPTRIGNQASFNDVVRYYQRIPRVKATVVYLPVALFTNGAMYFNADWRRRHPAGHVIVHNNFIVGHDAKKKRFVELQLWRPE